MTDSANGLDPDSYREWRSTPLGAITEAAEQALVFRLAGPLTGLRVLDAGCGDGAYAMAAAKQGARVSAVDTSPRMIEAARQRAAEAGLHIEFQVADAAALPLQNGSFDAVFAVTVLCFVPDARAAIREMSRVLAPGGRLVLGELGRWSLWAALRRIRAWLGSRIWRSATFRTAQQLQALVSEAGLIPERVGGAIFYPPFGIAARLIAPIEPWLSAWTTVGAAFVAVAAIKPPGAPARTSNRK